MATKLEMKQELDLLRKRLRDNEELLQAAAIKAEDMMALQDKFETMKGQVERLKRVRK